MRLSVITLIAVAAVQAAPQSPATPLGPGMSIAATPSSAAPNPDATTQHQHPPGQTSDSGAASAIPPAQTSTAPIAAAGPATTSAVPVPGTSVTEADVAPANAGQPSSSTSVAPGAPLSSSAAVPPPGSSTTSTDPAAATGPAAANAAAASPAGSPAPSAGAPDPVSSASSVPPAGATATSTGPAASSATAGGGGTALLRTKNWCTETVYLAEDATMGSNPCPKGPIGCMDASKNGTDPATAPYVIAPGQTHDQPFIPDNVSVSLKFFKAAISDFPHNGILQFEYTLTDKIWIDLSNIDGTNNAVSGSPFADENVQVTESGDGANQDACQQIVCAKRPPGAPMGCPEAYNKPDDNTVVRSCPLDTGVIYLDLCMPDAQFNKTTTEPTKRWQIFRA